MLGSEKVKLVAATRALIMFTAVTAKVAQVGELGMPVLSLVGCKKMRLFAVTAVVFTVYVVVKVGTATTPEGAEAHAAGEAELTAQFVVVLIVVPFNAVKLPSPGVVPMVPGLAKVAPERVEAFRLATLVVLAITSGAVPVVTELVSCPVTVNALLTLRPVLVKLS